LEIGSCGVDCFDDSYCADYSENRCDGNNLFLDSHDLSCADYTCEDSVTSALVKECEYRCVDGVCIECEDSDFDLVCDYDDRCTNTKLGEEVDQLGCSNPQFCKGQGQCGLGCESADWKSNEPSSRFPGDCITVVIEREGTWNLCALV